MAEKRAIHTSDAPAAIGTYSQAIASGQTVYLSGQIPLDPESMTIVSDTFADQANQVFKNLRAVAQASGANLDQCVKLTIYLTDLGNFQAVNEIMAGYFEEPYPARAAIQVSALPKDALIEIDGIITT